MTWRGSVLRLLNWNAQCLYLSLVASNNIAPFFCKLLGLFAAVMATLAGQPCAQDLAQQAIRAIITRPQRAVRSRIHSAASTRFSSRFRSCNGSAHLQALRRKPFTKPLIICQAMSADVGNRSPTAGEQENQRAPLRFNPCSPVPVLFVFLRASEQR